jgi:NDP-sugar pyrophosphorylase family protein
MKAMILAAGLGTRLRPLTLEKAKPAIPLVGVAVVVRLIQTLMDQGVTKFRLNLHHLPQTIEQVFEASPRDSLPVSFSYEPEILGTAGGLKANESFFDDPTFVMANGDIFIDFPLEKAVAFHREKGALATLVLFRQDPPYRYLPVQIDEEGRLCNFKDARTPVGRLRPEAFVFTGIHILEPEIFEFIPGGCFYEINDQVYPTALKSGRQVLGFPVEGYWNDLGDPGRYLAAQRDLLIRSGRVPPVHVSPAASISSTAGLGRYVSVEAGSILEDNSFLENDILWENVLVRSGVRIRNCIAGSGVTIESECVDRIVTRHGEALLATD